MTEIDFEAIRLANPLSGYCERHGIRLRRSGNTFLGKCPLHNEQNGTSFVVFEDNRWKCFGKCDRTGDVLNLDVALYGGTTVEAARRLGGLIRSPLLATSRASEETKRSERPYQLTDRDQDLLAKACVTLRRS